MIKYYLIGWMSRQIDRKRITSEMAAKILEFSSYKKKKDQIKEMKKHYENTFKINIDGV